MPSLKLRLISKKPVKEMSLLHLNELFIFIYLSLKIQSNPNLVACALRQMRMNGISNYQKELSLLFLFFFFPISLFISGQKYSSNLIIDQRPYVSLLNIFNCNVRFESERSQYILFPRELLIILFIYILH